MGGAARRARPQTGSDLRYDLRITFEEAVLGTEKEIEFPVLGRCDTCSGSGAKPGTAAGRVPAVQGPRRAPVHPPDDARPDGQRQPVPALPGRGQDRRDAVRDLPRRGPHRAPPDAPGHDPRGHRRGPPDPALERGRGRAARRSAGLALRRGPRDRPPGAHPRGHGALLRGRPHDRAGGAGHEDPRPHGRGRRHRGRDQARHAARAPRSASGAAASRTSAAPRRAATSTSSPTSSCPRSSRRSSASCSRRSRRSRATDRRAPGPAREAGPRVSDDPRAGDDPRDGDPLAGLDLEQAAREPGSWLELAVSADHEAVEAVSEILSRAAPGGTSVEPAFELVEEGLAARVDLERPARVRAHLPLTDVAVARAAVARAERELGHLQAFGLRPIGDLTATVVREADWANAWKAHFPVLRDRPADRHPADLAAPPPPARRRGPGAGPGHGVRDRPPPDDPAVPRGARVARGPRRADGRRRRRRPGPRPGRRLRVRDPLDRGRAARRPRGARRRRRPDRRRGVRARTPAATGSAA